MYETSQVEAAFDDSTSWVNWKCPDFFRKQEEYLKQKTAFTKSLVSNESILFSGAKSDLSQERWQLPKM